MNMDFPRILTLLRKERNLSQRQVASDLKISQALLSHYENGARECGLDFLSRCADYFDVSCDYLLGKTSDRRGARFTVDDIPSNEPSLIQGNKFKNDFLPMLNKKLISNSLNIIFSLLQKSESKLLTGEISTYLMTSIYKAFRIIYSTHKKNPQNMFALPEQSYSALIGALQDISESNARCIANRKAVDALKNPKSNKNYELSPRVITNEYPNLSASLYNVIKNVENKIPIKTYIKTQSEGQDAS